MIGFITTNETRPWDGSEELWSQAAMFLAKQGKPVQVNVPRWDETPAQIRALLQTNCGVTFRKIHALYHPLEKVLDKVFPLLRYRWLKKHVFSLIVISEGFQYEGAGWMEACRHYKIPYVTLTHAAISYRTPESRDLEKIINGYQHALKNYFVSHHNRFCIESALAVSFDGRSALVKNPCKIQRDTAMPYPDMTSGIKLACVARLNATDKGHDILIEMMAEEKWRQRPVEITFYGYGSHEKALKKLVHLRRLENKIHFSGHAANIEDIWKNHHALVLASRQEGLPLTVVEAMMCARPCIVTKVGDNDRVVKQSETGYIAKAPTVEIFDETMELAWQEKDKWAEIGQRAFAFIRGFVDNDSVSKWAEELKEISRGEK